MEKAVVVILNYNGRALLQKFLPFIVQYSTQHRIVVVDNASSDDSVSYLSAHYPSITCLQHHKNEGFARGYNLALQQIEATYYILLNADVQVTPHWIEPVLALMEKDENIGACQPKILSYQEKNIFEYAGAGGGFIDLLGYPFCRGRLFDTLELDKGQYDDVCEIFWASGACMFLRASAFWQIGGFDERLFAYYEEIDLCWRMQQQGFCVFYQGHTRVYHVGQGTFGSINPFVTYLKFRNRALVLYKNVPRHFLGWKHILRFLLDIIAVLRAWGYGKFKEGYAILRAQVSFFSYKKYYKPPIAVLPLYLVYQGLIPLAYFLKGKKIFPNLDLLKFKHKKP